MINLIDPDKLRIPNEAISVLSKGPGFVPTPKFDREKFRLDATNCENRLGAAAIKTAAYNAQSSNDDTNQSLNEESALPLLKVPKDLMQTDIISQRPRSSDNAVELIRREIREFGNSDPKNFEIPKKNLTALENKGLSWLKTAVTSKQICILSADKGGALVIMEADQVTKIIKDTLSDAQTYENLGPSFNFNSTITKLYSL